MTEQEIQTIQEARAIGKAVLKPLETFVPSLGAIHTRVSRLVNMNGELAANILAQDEQAAVKTLAQIYPLISQINMIITKWTETKNLLDSELTEENIATLAAMEAQAKVFYDLLNPVEEEA